MDSVNQPLRISFLSGACHCIVLVSIQCSKIIAMLAFDGVHSFHIPRPWVRTSSSYNIVFYTLHLVRGVPNQPPFQKMRTNVSALLTMQLAVSPETSTWKWFSPCVLLFPAIILLRFSEFRCLQNFGDISFSLCFSHFLFLCRWWCRSFIISKF